MFCSSFLIFSHIILFPFSLHPGASNTTVTAKAFLRRPPPPLRQVSRTVFSLKVNVYLLLVLLCFVSTAGPNPDMYHH